MATRPDRASRQFPEALLLYEQARALATATQVIQQGHDRIDPATEALDVMLDGLLAAKSDSWNDFRRKLFVVRDEYGTDVQPRHFAALLADAQQLEFGRA